MAIASAELIAELDRTVRAIPVRPSRMLRRVADLISATADRLGPAGDEPIAEAG